MNATARRYGRLDRIGRRARPGSPRCWAMPALALVLAAALAGHASAQTGVTVTGQVTHIEDGSPIALALIAVENTSVRTITDDDGRFRLTGVPVGQHVLVVSWFSTGEQRVELTVPSGGVDDVAIEFRPIPFSITGVMVTGASKVPQRFVDAPVAIEVVERVVSRNYSSTGQHPQVIKALTGMDVSANGIHDFNVNSRGFNADLSQRLLVLMDGRDLAIPFLAAQEWSALTMPLDDMERIEVVRGPGSALYGANAYNGVINIITPAARDVLGTKVALAGGELRSMRGDLRHARTFGVNQRFGVRTNVGYYRSDDWHESRTNLGDFESEYSEAIDVADFPINTPPPGYEAVPLNGQTLAAAPGVALGRPSPVESVYGSARFDLYAEGGAVGTVEGGAARVANQLFMTNVGRFQVDHAWRPWARAAWADDRFNVMAWYSGRSSEAHAIASGAPLKETSSLLHLESQWNTQIADGRARLVFGGSYRRALIDSRGTLVAPIDDGRNDWYGAGFAQVDVELTPGLHLVAAGRLDGSNLFDREFSPKGALVFTPTESHSFRVSAGAAYQTPRLTNFFLNVPLGLPADLDAVETSMRTMFPAALAAVPVGTLFTESSAVPALALGNSDLDVERLTSYEAGYRGEFDRRIQLTVDVYYSVVRDFVSALLPSANPAYGPWTAPAAVPASDRAALETAVLDALGPGSGLTNLSDGSSAIVFSYGNA
ncbi:MAG: TonB-dependent receptor, partial [Gemmatimonadota bacterium]|nr:TonB-dependent receptor [Gemmatimonadota bacterium]